MTMPHDPTVRGQLAAAISERGPRMSFSAAYECADAVLERLIVTEKPAIDDQELGVLMHRVGLAVSERITGARLRLELSKVGLVIVEDRS